MKAKERFDYLFVLWGMPFRESPGAVNRQVYSLSNKLARDKKKVGIIFVSYYSVAKKYHMARDGGMKFRIKSLLSGFLYSRFISRIPLYFFKKRNNSVLDREISLYASGIKLPLLDAGHVVTSYWWGVILAGQIYQKEKIYFIVYHDYYYDILNSNRENIGELEKAYSSSYIILANKALRKKFQWNPPLITEGIDTGKYRCNGDINSKIEDIILVPLRNNPLKGKEYAIPALKMIQSEFPEVKIVGYGDSMSDIPDFIDFQHVISDETLREYYCKATYFILPSIVEGIPEPLLEAMAAGCACISTACGGPQEVINDGVNGMLVPVKDPESIFVAFKKLYRDKNLTRSIMAQAMESAMKYDLNRTYDDFINAIKFYDSKNNLL